MNTIFRTEFGSVIYGTNLPTSDVDYKSVFVPQYRDIILQRAPRTINTSTKEDKNARNTKDDIDEEFFALQEYCRLLADGQTVALDMIFTPEKHWQKFKVGGYEVDASMEWLMLRHNRDKFIHKGTASFVGYTKQQAAKYGIKGFRVSAVESTLALLKSLNPFLRLNNTAVHMELMRHVYTDPFHPELGLKNEHVRLVEIPDKGNGMMLHLEVCNRKVPFHCTVKYATELFQKIYDEYGARARLAKENQGIDWKALMHAVRVAREAEELLLTGNITFPRPEKDLLLQIRKGELDYETQVAPLIEEGLVRIEQAKLKSTLPDAPNKEWIDDFVYSIYSHGKK